MTNQNYNFSTHYGWLREHERLHSNSVIKLSDWNNSAADVFSPTDLVRECHRFSVSTVQRYTETQRLHEITEQALHSLKFTYNLEQSDVDLHFFGNATQVIFAIIFCLSRSVKVRLAVLNPSYYTIPLLAKQLEIPLTAISWIKKGKVDLDIDKLFEGIASADINVLLLTDPIYCLGTRIPADILNRLVELCESRGIWIVIDGSFGRMSWRDDERVWVDRDLIKYLDRYERLILIDSPAKRLFINGMKLGIAYGQKNLIDKLRAYSDIVIGNLTSVQARFAELIFSSDCYPELHSCCLANTNNAKDNFRQIYNYINSSDFYIIRPDEGFHCCLFDTKYLNGQVDPMIMCKYLLDELGVYALPTHDFFFGVEDWVGIRLNLMTNFSGYENVFCKLIRSGSLIFDRLR